MLFSEIFREAVERAGGGKRPAKGCQGLSDLDFPFFFANNRELMNGGGAQWP